MLPADTPKLPKWPFLLGDAALLGLAWLIGAQSRAPFAGTPLLAILACVVGGAIIAAVPFLTDYARKQDEALDERQRSLEALSRTVAASAEQLGIAANGLNEITQLSQRNLVAAEQLPARLQEIIASLKSPVDTSRDAEKEELKRELARLRASEAGRLQAAADQITKAAAELAHLASIRPEPGPAEPGRSVEPARPEPVEESRPEAVEGTVSTSAPAEPASTSEPDSTTPGPTPSPRRPRKPREAPVKISSVTAGTPQHPVEDAQAEEPPPIPAATIPEIAPVAPDSNPPIPSSQSDALAPVAADAPAPKPERKRAPRKPKPGPQVAEATAPKNQESEIEIPASTEPSLDLVETPVAAAAEVVERAVSSDGATRLLVTAYIGIGNRLFIRGSGPGLSWDKGLPLQFVSIGKWRWETNEAAAPVQFKLYKNDDGECMALGTQILDPGQQQEVTATF